MMSACGVMCSECPAYQGKARGVAHQKEVADAWKRIYNLDMEPAKITCGGCLGPDEELFFTMGRCRARVCCRSKGFESCAECPTRDCPDLEKAQSVWDSVPDIARGLSPQDVETYARPYLDHRRRLAEARKART